MVRQSIAIGGRNMQVLAVAGLLAFCSPYPVLKERVMPCCFSWWRWRDGGGAYDGIAWPGLFMPMTISSVLGQPAGLVPRVTPCWRRSWPGCLGCGRCPSWD